MPFKDPERARQYNREYMRKYNRDVRTPARRAEAKRLRELGYLGPHGGQNKPIDVTTLPYVAFRRRGGRWHVILRGPLQPGDILAEPFAVVEE
jgi:hypothetical protein